MNTVFQYKLPVWHPQAVHFPIALLLTAVAVGLVWVVVNRPIWRQMTLILLGLGAASGIVAYQTGETLLEHVSGTPIVDELIDAHAASAQASILISLLAFLGLGVYAWLRRTRPAEGDPLHVRLLFFAAIVAAGVLVGWTGHLGGTMVWGVAR